MRLIRRGAPAPARLGIFPGSFNPLTAAHMAVARAGLGAVDEVLFVLPESFPHKGFQGASFSERIEMLSAALEEEPAFSLASSEGGLFAEIAAECRAFYPPAVRLSFLCGRDAAERASGWDYGRPGAFSDMLRSFDLMVAARGGEYEPEAEIGRRVERIAVGPEWAAVSASEVRRRILSGELWEHLVPAAIREQAKRIYSRQDA